MSTLPPLPQINGDIDLMLDVYTHESLRPMPTTLNDDYGDTFRLQELGQKAFELVVTFHLFNERPLLDKGQITVSNVFLWPRSGPIRSKGQKGCTS
ncbi:hypothetical protein BDN70DRAFT_846274 [Pholiota conissans]|uniref:Uncharacterized protein n=1 Tax=Pholiota conissans TaxID=109636 RepID=A0A9P6D0K5_9AGAR|nr:hypothetical protein BDN70DRAFT_846274 [Pholiota conissans]